MFFGPTTRNGFQQQRFKAPEAAAWIHRSAVDAKKR